MLWTGQSGSTRLTGPRSVCLRVHVQAAGAAAAGAGGGADGVGTRVGAGAGAGAGAAAFRGRAAETFFFLGPFFAREGAAFRADFFFFFAMNPPNQSVGSGRGSPRGNARSSAATSGSESSRPDAPAFSST